MIPSWQGSGAALNGAWRLALRDPDALEAFDLDADAFWRSFFAMVLGFPLWFYIATTNRSYLIDLAALRGETLTLPDPAFYIAVGAAAYAVNWLLFLILMIPLSRVLDASANYARFVVTRNWAMLLALFLLATPSAALYNIGVLSAVGKANLDLVALIVELTFFWHVTRVSLDVNGVVALGLCPRDLLISLRFFDLTASLYGL